MNLRTTGQYQVGNALAYISQQSAALTKYREQVSSGLKVQRPSDDPTAYPLLTRAKDQSARLSTYTGVMSDATALLNTGVSSLGEVNTVLVRAKQIAIEGGNATTDAGGYEALAAELDNLFDRALRAANTAVDGSYIFGGTATDTPPFRVATTGANGQPATVAYDGAAERGRVLIGPNQTSDTRYAGDAVFQRAGKDVFGELIALRDALRDPATTPSQKAAAVQGRIAGLDAARGAVGDAVAEQASNLAGLEALTSRLADLKLTADTRSGDLEGTDYADAVVKMQQQTFAVQATLAVSAQLLGPSLLDFIR